MVRWWADPAGTLAAEQEAREEWRITCPHWAVQGYGARAQGGLRPGQCRCLNPACWQVFSSDEEWIAASEAAICGEED